MQRKHRGRIKIALSIAAVILMFLAAALWLLNFALGESGPFLHDSWQYRTLVPDAIRNLPMDYCSEPIYYIDSVFDGGSVTRRCHTRDPSAAMAYYRALFLSEGYRQIDDHPSLEWFRAIARSPVPIYFRWGDDYIDHDDHYELELASSAPDQFTITYLHY